MVEMRCLRGPGGMVLVMALWVLSILSVFALFIGIGIRQKLFFVSRLERRADVHHLARAGVQAARSVLMNMPQWQTAETAQDKMIRHNNPRVFRMMDSSGGLTEVFYRNYDGTDGEGPVMFYGLEDESGKLNVNYASVDELSRIFMLSAGLNQDSALDLAKSIVEWRSPRDQRFFGRSGDEYYSRLNFPYEPKGDLFEKLEELLLVRGMNPDIFHRSEDFLTIYGDGIVNLNAGSRPVFIALGLSPETVDSVIYGRNGADQIHATEDDYIFSDAGEGIQWDGFFPLGLEGAGEIEGLFAQKKIAATGSGFFKAKVRAALSSSGEIRFIDCVIRAEDAKIISWREY